MQNGKEIAAGVAFGYLLGRTKKMKLALMLGAAAMGSRLDMKSLARKGTELIEASPGAKRLATEIAGRVGGTGKAAVGSMAAKGMDALSDTLERRTGQMRSGGSDEDAEPEESEEPEEEEQEDEEPKRPRRRSSGKSSSSDGSRSGGGKGGSDGRSKSGSTARKRSSGASKRTTGTRQRRSRTSG
ncbi:MAG: hypothetical protein J2P24_17860 [Streptosporangiales bacterium]|nr:hypothetical protein [Streptosporangiales bacterium]MBO0889689.1 hypothetical protein [Acidothermales bacterium]